VEDPPGVVTRTTRAPVDVPAAIDSVAVTWVPPEFTATDDTLMPESTALFSSATRLLAPVRPEPVTVMDVTDPAAAPLGATDVMRGPTVTATGAACTEAMSGGGGGGVTSMPTPGPATDTTGAGDGGGVTTMLTSGVAIDASGGGGGAGVISTLTRDAPMNTVSGSPTITTGAVTRAVGTSARVADTVTVGGLGLDAGAV
jgi:hypothetical protein